LVLAFRVCGLLFLILDFMVYCLLF